ASLFLHISLSYRDLHSFPTRRSSDLLLAARKVQRDLVATASSDINRSDIIAEFALIDIYVRDAHVLLHFEPANLAEVAIALEERSEEHTSELQSRSDLVCRLLLEKKK